MAARGAGSEAGRAKTPFGVLLPLACLASALVLGASELMTTFTLVDATREPVREIGAFERHAGAMLVLAVFAIVALAIAVGTGSKAAAIAVAVSGGVALLIFLTTDLPDAGQVGALSEPGEFLANAEARPQAGFWLELLGALSLAVSGAALATLTPEQLSLRRRATASEEAGDVEGTGDGQDLRREPAHVGSRPESVTARRASVEPAEAEQRVSERVERARRAAARRRQG